MLMPLSLLPRFSDIIYTCNSRPSSELSPFIFWDNPRLLHLMLYIEVSPNQVILRGGNRKNIIYRYFYVLVSIYVKNNIPVYVELEKVFIF
jgi:hypothetical protein